MRSSKRKSRTDQVRPSQDQQSSGEPKITRVRRRSATALNVARTFDAPLDRPKYNIDLTEAGAGSFHARCRETGHEITSPNAEHDIAHALTVAGAPDAPVQFWRNQTPSLSHPSVHQMGRYRIALGEEFPQRIRRRVSGPQITSQRLEGVVLEPDIGALGTDTALPRVPRP